jgi:GntR family histidine utilization transcriptional repressor
MSDLGSANSWQAVRREVLRRIQSREWAPGELIPHEADLAVELGCARATVNRALREVAETGLIERRRRAGTRVAVHPVRKATLDIPVIRIEVESRGEEYGYTLLSREKGVPPPQLRARLQTPPDRPILHLVGLHMADGRPHALEDRWIDTDALPAAAEADFATTSPNEWLVRNVPFEGGDIAFSASVAEAAEAEALGCTIGAPLFVTDRTTWHADRILTTVRLLFAPGYRLHTRL